MLKGPDSTAFRTNYHVRKYSTDAGSIPTGSFRSGYWRLRADESQNPGGRSDETPKIRSKAMPARQSVPSSKSLPIRVTPCGTRRGGENVGTGWSGSGAQSLRAFETSTKPARRVREG